MRRFLAITGTPGTGKKTLAPVVARLLGVRCIALNDLLRAGERGKGSPGVEPEKLRQRLLKRAKGGALVYGHLVPDALGREDVERVLVLRCDPSALRRRLRSRGYSPSKVEENVEAELIGVVSAGCIDRFGRRRCAELDTTSRGPRSSAAEAARLLVSPRAGTGAIDWVPLYSSAEKLRSLLSDPRTDSAFT